MKKILEPYFKDVMNDLSNLEKEISNLNGQLLFVGGCIRNPLINHFHQKNLSVKDFDLVIVGLNEEIMDRFISNHKYFKKEQQGKSFGVYIYRIKNISYEIALSRVDKQVGDSHKDIVVETNNISLFDDALRRESRMNSLYLDFNYNIIDPLDFGIEDIKKGIIHHNSDAFSEDPLRTIRACRQASQFEFTIHDNTIDEIIKTIPYLKTIDSMRVHEEFKKILLCKNNVGLNYMKETSILTELFGVSGDFNTDFDNNLSIELKLYQLTINFNQNELKHFFDRIQAKKDWVKFINILKQHKSFLVFNDFSDLNGISECFETIKRSTYTIEDFSSNPSIIDTFNNYFSVKANTDLPTTELISDLKNRKFNVLVSSF